MQLEVETITCQPLVSIGLPSFIGTEAKSQSQTGLAIAEQLVGRVRLRLLQGAAGLLVEGSVLGGRAETLPGGRAERHGALPGQSSRR